MTRLRHSRRRAREAMTLFELMVVIALIALAAAVVMFGAGAVTNAELKNAALRVVSASRFAASRAVIKGTTTRLLFDLSQGTMAVEEAKGTLLIARADDPRRSPGDEAVIDPWAAAEARLEKTLEPSLGTSSFSPVAGQDNVALTRYAPKPLGRNIRLARLAAVHEPEEVTEGQASVYFFPSGVATEAIVWLQNARGDSLSVVFHPLTGHARIEPGQVAAEPFADGLEDEASEVRDPG